MNAESIMSLVSNLYEQLVAAQQANAELSARVQELEAEVALTDSIVAE